MHLHRGGHAFHQPYTLGNHVKMDPHGNAQGQPHSCEDRVHVGDASGVGLPIRHVDRAAKTVNVPLISCGKPISQILAGSPPAIGPIVVSSKYPSTQNECASTSERARRPTTA